MLQDPYVLSEASEVNYVLRFFLGDFREESIGIKARYLNHYRESAWKPTSSTRSEKHLRVGELFAQLTGDSLERWIQVLPTLSDDSVALACRALAHTTLNEQQLDVLKTMALDKQNAEIAVLVLLNSGFEYTENAEQREYSYSKDVESLMS